MTSKRSVGIRMTKRQADSSFVVECISKALNYILTRDAAVDVTLSVEENFSIPDVILFTFANETSHQIIEVLLFTKNLTGLIILSKEIVNVSVLGSALDHTLLTLVICFAFVTQ